MANDAWQIGSTKPPTVCLCCGQRFDRGEHKRKGPYLESPYIWVCEWCWKKPYLFFPDKEDNYTKANYPQAVQQARGRSVGAERTMRLSIMEGITISAKLRDVPLDDLTLDPNNVRFGHLRQELSQEELTGIILSDPTTKTLYNQILYAHGLTNSPLVDSDLLVREGNRRIVCLRKIRDEIIEGKWDIPLQQINLVQCIVLPPHVPEKQIAIYLTREHVVGKKSWRAVNQAAFVHKLRTVHSLTYEQIKQAVGVAPGTLSVMERAYTTTIRRSDPGNSPQARRYYRFYVQ